MMSSACNAPGGPGILPHWTSSAKSGVGTALSSASKVWFTLSHGIFNEIYYPDLAKSQGEFVLALGFGASPDEAAQSCLDSLRNGFDKARNDYIRGWQAWQKTLDPPQGGDEGGRLWPLLVGERAHFELAAGHAEEARRLLHTMESLASAEGLIPEQTWDAADMPERELSCGRPSGSAMPLVWAHAEYVKLRRSLETGGVFDMPPQTVKRYLKDKTVSSFFLWRFSNKCKSMPAGKTLRLELLAPATVHWSTDQWETAQDTPTRDTGLGIHVADLATEALSPCHTIAFTFHWTGVDRWEGSDFGVKVTGGERSA